MFLVEDVKYNGATACICNIRRASVWPWLCQWDWVVGQNSATTNCIANGSLDHASLAHCMLGIKVMH